MKRFFVCCALLLELTVTAPAAPLSRDLGQGLGYYRIHQLPADLPTADAMHRQACVLDLRYMSGNPEAAAALAAWLKFNSTEHAPVFVLANADTGAELLAAIVPRGPGMSVVLLGAASPGFTPDIALNISPDTERRAYDALEQGATIETLLNENPDKPRNDEAQLEKERQSDAPAADELNPPAAPDADIARPKRPPPLIDVVLRRAVQLHRTLLALRKI